MKRLKAGIVGMGFVGPIHLESLRRLGYIETCIAESDMDTAKKRAAQYDVQEYYDGWNDMIDKAGIDVIHICAPNNLHYPIAKKAMEKGINVVCDKPLSLDIKEAQSMAAMAKETKLINAITFNTFYYPLVSQARHLIKSNKLGRINFIQGFYFQDWLFYDSDYNWRVEAVYSGLSRVIGDIGSHCLYILQGITGQKIISLYADFNTFVPVRKKPVGRIESYQKNENQECEEIKVDTEDQATLLLEFENGAKGVFVGGQTCAGRKNKLCFEIHGSEKSIAWNAERADALWIGERDTANHCLMKDFNLLEPGSAKLCDFAGGLQEGYAETWKNLMKLIYAAVLEGKHQEGIYPTFEDGLYMQRVVDASYKSSVSKQWVKV